jgi:hypothetical protein
MRKVLNTMDIPLCVPANHTSATDASFKQFRPPWTSSCGFHKVTSNRLRCSSSDTAWRNVLMVSLETNGKVFGMSMPTLATVSLSHTKGKSQVSSVLITTDVPNSEHLYIDNLAKSLSELESSVTSCRV